MIKISENHRHLIINKFSKNTLQITLNDRKGDLV